jgi:5-methylcytosine-specific restriction endonuclease McrA
VLVATKKSEGKGNPIMRHWLTNKLRRLSYQWPPRKQAIKNARIARGKYRCNSCLGENFGPKDIQLDHIIPVVDEEIGFVDWNTYIERLFCSVDNFQVLCKPCHGAKTFFEQEIRKQVKHEKKKDEDDI